MVVRTAQGSWITDIDGRKYLDCLAAYSAANLGHHHPKVVNALMRALVGNYASVISNVIYTDPLAMFLSKTAEFVPQLGPRFGMNGNKVMPKNGGVEAEKQGKKLKKHLMKIAARSKDIKEVRGKGLFISIEVKQGKP